MKNVLVLLFPGFGYGPDKPLLHYAAKCAKAWGFDVAAVHYSWLDSDETHSLQERTENSLNGAVKDALQVLKEADGYRKMIFVSKSFGTFVAGEVQKILEKQGADIYQIFLTPLPMTYDWYMKGQECISVTGLEDPLMTSEARNQMKMDPKVEFLVAEGCNQSMEDPDDPVRSAEVLCQITELMWNAMQKQKTMLK